MSSLTEKKKLKKALKPKAKETVTALSLAQPVDHHSQGATPVIESSAFCSKDPDPTAAMIDHHIFAELESLDESAAYIESIVASPMEVPIPEQDPSLNRVPSPVRDPTSNKVPTPVRDSSSKQASIPSEDPIHTVNPISVRCPSPSAHTFSTQVEQAFEQFVKWKSYRTAPYDVLFNWKEWKEEELFNLDVTGTNNINLLIHWENQLCQELIFSHYLAQEQAKLKEQRKTDDIASKNDSRISHNVAPEEEILETLQGQGNSGIISSPHHQPKQVVSESFQEKANPPVSHAIPLEESVALPVQAIAERQQEEKVSHVPLSTETPEAPHVAAPSTIDAPSSFRCSESPHTEARKEQLDSLC
ncbi:hypothetical protein OROMI_024059 [Orobanche minor]